MTQQDSDHTSVPPDARGTDPQGDEQESEERITVRDRRRIDPNGTAPRTGGETAETADDVEQADTSDVPETSQPEAAEADTEPVGTAGSGDAGSGDAGSGDTGSAGTGSLRAELDERTRDLKRVVAEYANYRRRVERDRTVAAEQATGAVLASLLPVLDDLDRAREHGDLVGPFGAVADQLVSVLSKAGLTPYGEAGDPFDPMHHEAVAHSLSPDVTEPTCVMVMRRGYRHGDRMLRPAMVAVAEPDPDAPASAEPADTAALDEPAAPEAATAEPDHTEPDQAVPEPEADHADASEGAEDAQPEKAGPEKAERSEPDEGDDAESD